MFATGNKLGVKIMSEVLYSAEEEFLDKKAAATQVHQLSLFGEPTEEELFALKIDQIADSIKAIGAGRSAWTYDDLYYELLLSRGWFGRITDQLFRYACKKLEKEWVLVKEAGSWSGKRKLIIKA
jgi:hypothetical protein